MKKLATALVGFVLCVAGLTAQPQPKPDPKDTGKKAHQTPQVAKKAVKKKAETKKGRQSSAQGKKGGSSNQ